MESSGPNSVIVNKVYRDCPIRIREYEFPGDLIELSFREFDVLLGMDWLFRHQVVVDEESDLKDTEWRGSYFYRREVEPPL